MVLLLWLVQHLYTLKQLVTHSVLSAVFWNTALTKNIIRDLIAEKDPEKAKAERPIRLAVIQLGTYDGTIYNARQVVDKIWSPLRLHLL